MPIFDIHCYLEGHPLPGYNQNAAQLIDLLHSRGIDRAVLLSTRAMVADPLSGNRILKAMLDQGPGLYGCLVAHVNRVDASIEAIRDMLGHRKFVGVMVQSGKEDEPLHPLVADEVLIACRRYQKPIFVNTPNAACVEVGLQLSKTYSSHKFVFLGMGGADWRTGIAAAQQAVNIFLDTSGALDRNRLRAAVEAVGPHRVLFGSGMPKVDAAATLALVANSNLTQNEQRRILHDNAMRLFGLEESD